MTTSSTHPLADIAVDVSRVQAMWVGASTAIVSGGVITLATSDAITALLGLIPGLLALAGTILGARQVAAVGEPLVTPVSDPRDNEGRKLVPAPPGGTQQGVQPWP